MTARFWPRDFNLRQQWDDAEEQYPLLKEFEIDPYYALQVTALLEPGVDKDGTIRAPSVKRAAVLDMKVNQARKGWEKAIHGLAGAVALLRDDCGVLDPGLLPYNTLLIPMAALWSVQSGIRGADAGKNRIKILRWFWCSVFGQTYENSPNSQAERDFADVQRWMKSGEPPESVKGFKWDIDLKQVSPRQRAVYRGVMALILQNGALDFYKRGKITSQLLADKKNPVDDHHIFPRAFLDSKGTPTSLRDCILNRTFIDRITNRQLSKRAPSDYFHEIRIKQGGPETEETLASHILPQGSESPLMTDDFEGFLEWREREIAALIRRKTQG